MPRDPMTSYEQSEAEADERTDEARREQHYREAEAAARLLLKESDAFGYHGAEREVMTASSALRNLCAFGEVSDHQSVLMSFQIDYGTPALLRVIATALEQK